jgi:uncharacterized phage-associated protein
LLLAAAWRRRRPVTPLALQKLIYFSHGHFLARTKTPLVKGAFEAWQYGPVHPQLYHAFKSWGRDPILERAERIDPVTGEVSLPVEPQDSAVIDAIERIVIEFGNFTPGQLVKLSHARGGPWHRVVVAYDEVPGSGVRITDDIIDKYFAYHKLSSVTLQMSDEVDEDSPLERHGLRQAHRPY